MLALSIAEGGDLPLERLRAWLATAAKSENEYALKHALPWLAGLDPESLADPALSPLDCPASRARPDPPPSRTAPRRDRDRGTRAPQHPGGRRTRTPNPAFSRLLRRIMPAAPQH
jgi:hypothetical protein